MGIMWDMENHLEGSAASGMEIDAATDQMVVHRTQDVQPLLDRNKRFQNSGLDGMSPTRDWKQVASIPNIILEKWLKEEGLRYWDEEHKHRLLKKLDDPEWAYLRTGNGHLGKRPYREYFKGSSSPS
jgi:hypothetical protein